MAYQSVTLSNLKVALADKYDNVPFWTGEEARLAINEGLRVYNAGTGFWRTRITPTCPVDDNYVPIPGNIAYKSRIEFNNKPLSVSSLVGLDGYRPSWEGENTQVAGVPNEPKKWAPISLDLIVIWPANHAPNQTLTIDGMAATPILVNDGDFIDLGQEEFSQLLGYALHILTFKLGGPVFKATAPLYQSWIKAIGDRNNQFRATKIYRKVLNIDIGKDQLPTRLTEKQ